MTTRSVTTLEMAQLASGTGVTDLAVTCEADTGHGPCGCYADWTDGTCANGHVIEIETADDGDEIETTVCGKQIQHDKSGVGHCWKNIDRDDIPADTIEEIEGEIIDGRRRSCDDYIASGGQHYRW